MWMCFFFEGFYCTLTMKIYLSKMNDNEAKMTLQKPFLDPAYLGQGKIFVFSPVSFMQCLQETYSFFIVSKPIEQTYNSVMIFVHKHELRSNGHVLMWHVHVACPCGMSMRWSCGYVDFPSCPSGRHAYVELSLSELRFKCERAPKKHIFSASTSKHSYHEHVLKCTPFLANL